MSVEVVLTCQSLIFRIAFQLEAALEIKAQFEELPKDLRIALRWGGDTDLFRDGFLVVPTRLLRGYALARRPLTTSETMLLLELMTFKWGAQAPYPSYERLGQIMGVSARMVARYAKSLEKKGYLKLSRRQGTSNEFDLEPLFLKIPRMPLTRAEDESAVQDRSGEKNI
jgi:hypothetical protein